MEKTNKSAAGRLKILGVVVAAVLVLSLAWHFNIQLQLMRLLDWISSLGAVGALLFVLVYIAATVLFLPGMILTLGAGRETRTAGEWTLYALGLLATVAVIFYVTRIARKALREKVEKGSEGRPGR